MKAEYIIYGQKTSLIYDRLKPEDKEGIERLRLTLLKTAGEKKVKQKIGFTLQFLDIMEKPISQMMKEAKDLLEGKDFQAKEDLSKVWGLLKISKHEYNTKVMIKKSIKALYKEFLGKGKADSLFSEIELPLGTFKTNQKKTNKHNLLKPQELQNMIHSAESLRDKAILMLLYESGCRPEELTKLKWGDIDFDSEIVHIFSNKTERARSLPIKEALLHLKRWRQEWAYPDVQDKDYIFPSRWRDKQLTTEWLDKFVKKISNKAGIKRVITPYTFRHSRLDEIHRLGVKGLEHNQFAGHIAGSKQIATYVHMNNEDMKEEILKKVYHKKELTAEEKSEIEKLKIKQEEQEKRIDELTKAVWYFVDKRKDKKELREFNIYPQEIKNEM